MRLCMMLASIFTDLVNKIKICTNLINLFNSEIIFIIARRKNDVNMHVFLYTKFI